MPILKNLNLAKTTAYRWITVSFASREEVEEYMDTQADAGRPLNRTQVIEIGERSRPPRRGGW